MTAVELINKAIREAGAELSVAFPVEQKALVEFIRQMNNALYYISKAEQAKRQ